VRLLLVDDDTELSALMQEFLSGHGIQITTARNGTEGLARALGGGYDLILLDLMMPGLDGFEVLRRLRRQSQTPVLMLTARTEHASRIEGLEAGADDYLPKPFEPLELLARVRAILRRAGHAAAGGHEALEASGIKVDPGARRVYRDGQPVEVTTIEYDILETLVRSAGRVVSRDELMLRLYQREATPFDRSIDVHVSHLRKKLEGTRELIRTVRGIGYQFAMEGAEEKQA
jgi:two-component system, OmpR family, response regulator CpxR